MTDLIDDGLPRATTSPDVDVTDLVGCESTTTSRHAEAVAGGFELRRFLVVSFLTGAALGMTAPITVLYALSFGASDAMAGLTWATIAIGLAAVDVFGTKFTPRLNGRMTMWLSLSIFSAGLAVSAAAPNLLVMIAGRVVQGAGAAIVMSGALQVIVRFTPPERTGRAIGAFNAAWFAGIAVGPLAGGLLSEVGEGQEGYRLAFWVSAATSVIVAIVARLVLPSVPATKPPRLSLPRRASPRHGLRVWPPLTLGTFSEASRGAIVFTLIPLMGANHLGLSTGTIGLALSALAIVDIASMRFGGQLADRIGRRLVFAVALAVGAVTCMTAPLIRSLPLFVVWCAALGVPVAMAWIIPAAMIVDVSTDTEAGLANYRIAADAGVASGSTTAGVAAGLAGPVGAIVATGGLLAVIAGWVWRLPEARVRAAERHDELPLVLPPD